MTKIVKSKKNQKFTTVFNHVLQKESLSFQAKGIYCYLSSLPDDWVIYKKEIMSHATNGRRTFESAWQELEDQGYLVGADQIRAGGKFMGRDYIFYDLTEEDKKAITDVHRVQRLVGQPMYTVSIGEENEKNPQEIGKNEDFDVNQANSPMYTTDVHSVQLLNTDNTKDLLLKKAQALTEKRKQEFANALIPFIPEYGKKTIRKFFDYWAEMTPNKKKMRWELEDVFEIAKRLANWRSRDDMKITPTPAAIPKPNNLQQ